MPSVKIEQPFTDSLIAGCEALAQWDWEEARDYFKLALKREETPEALEGLGMAAWWLADAITAFDARERAYKLYRERGDRLGAARMATVLAWAYNAFREPVIANGWLQRAHRLLKGCGPVAEHGWTALLEGEIALSVHKDIAAACRLSAQGAALGRSLGLNDLELVGLSLEGLALVRKGEVAEGMHHLDEAMAATVAGELTNLNAIGAICCNLIYACEQVRDYGRAVQWCNRLEKFCKRWGIHSLFTTWRTQHATVLIWSGAWAEAEAELMTAVGELAGTSHGKMIETVVRLAELRRRQGRLEEAAALFTQAEFHPSAQLGHAELVLDQGDAATAAELVDRFLLRIPPEHWAERMAGLELLVRVQVALGDYNQASATLAELPSDETPLASEPLRASIYFADGLIAAAMGDHERARCRFGDALDRFECSSMPFETAKARIELARSLHALDRGTAAEKEIRTSLDSLQRMGAARLTDQAAGFLRELENKTHGLARESSNPAGLTRRELEVLHLVAQGQSNHEIATRLVLSDHTVHRHIANILTKLDLPTRAAAVAFAARHKLL